MGDYNNMRAARPTYIIAEAGVNHNGCAEMAFQLVDAAVDAGVDAVKFQTFKAENLLTKNAEKAIYQKQTTDGAESQYAMLKRLELAHEIHHELAQYCREREVEFLSTAFDFDSLSFLVNELKLKKLKIPSGEITNGPLLLAHAQTKHDIILSTGMSTLGEVEEALAVLAFGLLHGDSQSILPSRKAFQKAYFSKAGQQILKEKVTVLHCTTEYPAPPQEIHLNAMVTMRNAFELKIGYSDHSEGIAVPIAAAATGAELIEKHFTLDRTLPGPDHQASLEPDELKAMVDGIRMVENAMGSGVKGASESELKNRPIARKSLVVSSRIMKGDQFSEKNLVSLRPGDGTSPMKYWEMLGKRSQQDYEAGEQIAD